MSVEGLIQRALKKVEPDSPLLNTAGIDTKIGVKIVADESGKVLCAKASGHPNAFLAKLSEEAAFQWEFAPLTSSGKHRKMTGYLVFKIVR